MSHLESRGRSGGSRRRLLRLLGTAALVCAAFVAPSIAEADTSVATLAIANPLITPQPPVQGGFGTYNFSIAGTANTFPFRDGAKIGHCVELNQEPIGNTVTLRTTPDFSGSVAADPARLQWLLESSRANSPGSAIQAGAHQSAIWQITNPGNAAEISGNTAASTLASTLLTNSGTYAAASAKGASLSVQGGADTTSCAGTTRTILVTGTPFTTATLSIASGVGTFVSSGTTSASVTLGPDGTGAAVLQSNANNPGPITVSANIVVSTMVQADGTGTQDFIYLEDQPQVRSVTVTFTDCRLTVAKTAEPKFNRTFTWTVQKTVTSASKVTVDAGGGTAGFNYSVVATKSAPVDSGWSVSGTISVTNPGPSTSATVTDALPNATCAVGGSTASTTITVAQGVTVPVAYVCTYAAQPVYTASQTNTATISWKLPTGTPISVTASAPFTFATGGTANPTVTGDSTNVTDVFNGGAPTTLGTANQTTTFPTSASFAVPATQTGCVDLPNVASVTSAGAPVTSTATVTACITPAGASAGSPDTTMSLTKSASASVIKPGGTVGFTIRWKNTGKSDAKDVVICDRLPSGMTFRSAPGASFKSGKACWSRSTVASGKSLRFFVLAKIDADAGARSFTNVATATASNAHSVHATAKVRSLPQKAARPGGVTG